MYNFYRKMKNPETSSLNNDSTEQSLELKEKRFGKSRINLIKFK